MDASEFCRAALNAHKYWASYGDGTMVDCTQCPEWQLCAEIGQGNLCDIGEAVERLNIDTRLHRDEREDS